MSIDLEQYHARGIKNLIKSAVKVTLKAPRQGAFLAAFSLACARAEKRRADNYALSGLHIPPFLIASITNSCNLHCAGCYARANKACDDGAAGDLLTAADWDSVFAQAEELGICFILLAGGEPLLRPEVLKAAAAHKNILFPVFTNGTLLTGGILELFDSSRCLIPILSIEGDAARTDTRRGAGMYDRIKTAMSALSSRGILFGASVTVTKENLSYVTDSDFTPMLAGAGCRLVFYIEYVPADGKSQELALTEEERMLLASRVDMLRSGDGEMMYLSFPGDEARSEGCLAAGRGFIHINPRGGAEPCPFSPFSDTNVKDAGLRAALDSPLFKKLTTEDILSRAHDGGCVLFSNERLVRQLLQST